jgi:hypothetical protein
MKARLALLLAAAALAAPLASTSQATYCNPDFQVVCDTGTRVCNLTEAGRKICSQVR